MANVKFNQATLFQKAKRLFRSLKDIAGDSFLKKDLAEFTRTLIYKRVKSGKGVTSDKTRFELTQAKRLTPLSNGYKRYRRTGYVEFEATDKKGRTKKVSINVGKPALGEFGSPNKSNLTMSGQLLSSITYNINSFGFTIYIPETIRRESKLTNARLARYLSENGRPFMNLTAGEIRIVKSRMSKTIQKRLRQLLK